MTKWYDHAFGDWYPRLYPHRNLAEATKVIRSIQSRLPGNGVLLDVGCGEGRHLRVLVEAGYSAVGIDRSFALLRRGRETHALDHRLIRADMRSLPFASGTFAAVLSMFTSFGYFGSEKAHVELLEELGRVCTREGCLILDYLNAPRVRKTLVPASRRMVEGHEVLETRSIVNREGEDLVVKEIRIQTEGGDEKARFHEEVSLYDRDKLLELLRHAGWRILDTWGDYENNPWNEASDRLILLARRGAA